jgi:Flp pilus assembly protein TadD
MILMCRYCGATMSDARPFCGRCGLPLVLVDEQGNRVTTEELNRRRRRAARWSGAVKALGASAILVIGVGVFLGFRSRDEGSGLSLHAAIAAAQAASADEWAMTGPAPSAEGAAAPAGGYSVKPAADVDAAVERALAALRDRPDDADALNTVGQLLVQRRRAAEAVPYLERAAAAAPPRGEYRFNLGNALVRAGDDERAVSVFKQLVSEDPRDVRALHNLGLALRRLGRDDEAETAFRTVTRTAPSEAPAWLGLGLTLDRRGSKDDAADALAQYLVLEPQAEDADRIRERIAQLRQGASGSRAPGAAR